MSNRTYRLLSNITLLVPIGAMVVVVCLTIYHSAWRLSGPSEPEAVTQFRRHKSDFEAFANGDRSEALRSRLQAAGVKTCHQKGDLTVFAFWFMSIDSVPQIYYSPSGRDGLPAGFWTGGENGNRYFDPRDLGENWFYCRWDQ